MISPILRLSVAGVPSAVTGTSRYCPEVTATLREELSGRKFLVLRSDWRFGRSASPGLLERSLLRRIKISAVNPNTRAPSDAGIQSAATLEVVRRGGPRVRSPHWLERRVDVARCSTFGRGGHDDGRELLRPTWAHLDAIDGSRPLLATPRPGCFRSSQPRPCANLRRHGK